MSNETPVLQILGKFGDKLPAVTENDNGKVLVVKDGQWVAESKEFNVIYDTSLEEKLLQLITTRLSQFVAIGQTEPDQGPALWFDTSPPGCIKYKHVDGRVVQVYPIVTGDDGELAVVLDLGDDTANADVLAIIDEIQYAVLNAEPPVVADDGSSCEITIVSE